MSEQLPNTRIGIQELVRAKVVEESGMLPGDIYADTELRGDCGMSDEQIDMLLLWCSETYGVDITNTQTEEIETVDDLVILLNCHRLGE